MSLWDRVTHFLAMEPMQAPPVQVRTDLAVGFDDFDSSILAIRRRQLRSQPWRQASIKEAMGVPAIFGAVNLAGNLVGAMSMKAFRGEVELPPDDRPRLIIRPDPFTIPREFYRSTAYNLASRGEAWWWVAARDIDGMALSLISVAPQEVKVEENERDLRYPIITWRNRVMSNEDFRQLVYSREPGSLRGVGPLQMCGAAVSVAVEAQEWSANTYAEGGKPSIGIKSASELDPTLQYDADGNAGTDYSEADLLRMQVTDRPANVPLVYDPNIEEIKEFGGTSAASEMLHSRDFSNGEVARMFSYPGSILDYYSSGSSLTYQNIGQEFEKLLRQALRPNYLEVIEQTMSDLLPRAIVARFNTDTLTLADIGTRWDVYNKAIPVLGQEEAATLARRGEGLAPGDVENAAIPNSPPQAVPASIQARTANVEVRCKNEITVIRAGVKKTITCNRRLGEGPPGSKLHCFRCKVDAIVPGEVMAKVIPLPLAAVRTAPVPQPEPEPVDPMAPVLEALESLPDRIAAVLPRAEPPQPMVLQVHEGAIRSEVHMPPVPRVQKRIERDGTGYIVTEE